MRRFSVAKEGRGILSLFFTPNIDGRAGPRLVHTFRVHARHDLRMKLAKLLPTDFHALLEIVAQVLVPILDLPHQVIDQSLFTDGREVAGFAT